MSETKRTPETVIFVGHHEQPITNNLVKDLLHHLRPGSVSPLTGGPPSDKEVERKFEKWASQKGALNVRYEYPAPPRPHEPIRPGKVEIVVSVRVFPSVTFPNGRAVPIPLYQGAMENWFEVIGSDEKLEHDSAFDMAFFFDKVHRTFSTFQPDFGFADFRSTALKNMGGEPRRLAWPALLYGSEMVQELGGRERILEAPVWRVDELGGGRLWLQVAENPFEASQDQLRALAEYLGLEVRER